MKLSGRLTAVVEHAVMFTDENDYEYVTPEILLYSLCMEDDFTDAFKECGGDVEKLSADLSSYINKYVDKIDDSTPEFSGGTEFVIAYAARSAAGSGQDEIDIRHVIHAIFQLKDSYAVYYMRIQGVEESDILRAMTVYSDTMLLYDSFNDDDDDPDDDLSDTGESFMYSPGRYADVSPGSIAVSKDDAWRTFAPCLNDTLKDVNPLIGRESELERTIQILCRKDKNNPLHIGEPGVGKTAITYGLVEMIREDRVPAILSGAKVFAMDLSAMVAGTQYRGDFEKRFKKVLSEISKVEKPIVFIDEIHNLNGAGAVGESSLDASNMLKSYLTDGHIRFIGATTFEEYKKSFEKSRSLSRRFQNVEIKEPSEDECVEILKGLREGYEAFHKVGYAEGVLEYIVSMSTKYINERFLPDKAIDLMDEAGAYKKLHPEGAEVPEVDIDTVNLILTNIMRVPVKTVETDDKDGLAELPDRLKSRVFGQDEAIDLMVNAVKFAKAGLLEEGKPFSSLLFVGPTGVGKTEAAKALAEELGLKLLRFDMSEYTEKHAVAKLIGSPAGYVGYEDGGLLTESIRKNPHAVLLLDEIEKAHQDIYNVLLSVMDYATLTDNQGRKADFRNVIIIMTSNAGASKIGKPGIGFLEQDRDPGVVMDAVKDTFQPEFRNRLNKIVVFNGMNKEMADRIIGKKLSELSDMLAKRNVVFFAEESAKSMIAERGISHEYGAREVERAINNEIKPLLVDELLFGGLRDGGEVTLKYGEEGFYIEQLRRY